MKRFITMRYPASWHGDMWRDGSPCGNGTVGAVDYGSVAKDIILLNHAKMWRDGKRQELPDVSFVLPEIRRRLDENRPDLANDLLKDALHEKGYYACTMDAFPLGDLILIHHPTAAHRHYRRFIDTENAEVGTEWDEDDVHFRRTLFASRADGLVYLRMTADKPGKVNIDVTADAHDKECDSERTEFIDVRTRAENDFVFYAGENVYTEYAPASGDYGTVTRVLCENGTLTASDGCVSVRNADSVTLVTDVFTGTEREKAFAEGKKKLSGITPYEEALEAHAKLHRALFCRVDLRLSEEETHCNEDLLAEAYEEEMSPELAETMYAFGRYLFICGTGENGELPIHLTGLWNGNYSAMWAINMYNINFQLIYSGALSGDLAPMLKNALLYVESFMDDYRENARKLFGCRGILVNPVNTPENGLAACLLSHILNWTGGAAWLSQLFYDYWRYTGDEDFLKEHALPFMAETALFYEDFLYKDENGRLVFAPGTSPENVSATTLKKFGVHAQASKNPSMDIALTRGLLTDLLEGAKLMKLYTEKLPVWEELLASLPDYKLNPDGSLKEWADDFYEDFHAHRHQSHMYAVWPGHSVTPDSPLFPAFVKAEDKRLHQGQSEMSSWGSVVAAQICARMEQGEKALYALSEMVRNCCAANLFTMGNDWRRMGSVMCEDFRIAPFQTDANTGFAGAVNEMLLNSSTGEVNLFPALPKRWKKGSVTGLCAVGGCKLSLFWNGDAARAEIENVKKGTVFSCGSGFAFPDGSGKMTAEQNGTVVLVMKK